MEPTLKAGSIHLVEGLTYLFRFPRLGEIVVFRNPRNNKEWICKRVKAFDPETKTLEGEGDNPSDSLDSRDLGVIQKSRIIGRVIL